MLKCLSHRPNERLASARRDRGTRFHHTACMCLAAMALSAASASARPPTKCRLGNQSDYFSIADEKVTEQTRKELRLRVLVDALDDVDIVFRGRLSKRWYLSDVHETEVPAILEVYDGVRVLKGQMPASESDGKAYLIREKVCDGGCWLNALPEVADGQGEPERVVLAMANTLAHPHEARDWTTKRTVYSGRIDALAGPCDPRQVNAAAAEMLMATPSEIERLKRTYPPRTAADKRRDEDFIIRRVIGVP